MFLLVSSSIIGNCNLLSWFTFSLLLNLLYSFFKMFMHYMRFRCMFCWLLLELGISLSIHAIQERLRYWPRADIGTTKAFSHFSDFYKVYIMTHWFIFRIDFKYFLPCLAVWDWNKYDLIKSSGSQ